MTDPTLYESPLSSRYASREMSLLFSPQFKYSTWRKLWVALASCQKTLGLPITEDQIKAMKACVNQIDFSQVEIYEKKFRHDVMAHIHAFEDQCQEAKGIIHLGATSCFVTDNGDLIQMQQALFILKNKLILLMRHLYNFSKKHASLPCLSYTHFQPAQPTTVGKRACLWLQDFFFDFCELEHLLNTFYFLGAKGATGTQASFLSLFNGDHTKVRQLEKLLSKEMGFTFVIPISGQTYTRKQDSRILSVLASFAASAHKFATDFRLLAHLKEFEEPSTNTQVGSSAMPHKHNPIRSERICGLARFLISLQANPLYTHATQWLERSLDDSSNRRLTLPDAFLTADALCNLLCSLTSNIILYPKIIENNLNEELPFLTTEPILMEAVKRGKDRQLIHEKLRQHSQRASRQIKEEGTNPDLLNTIAQDSDIGLSIDTLQALSQPHHFLGRAVEQTLEFLSGEVAPLLEKHKDLSYTAPDIRV